MFAWLNVTASRIRALFSRSRLDQDFDQEARLTLREAEGADGLGALRRLLVDVPVRRRLGQVHRKSSATRGSNAPPRPPLPPLAWM